MEFIRDSFKRKGKTYIRVSCDDNGVKRSLQIAVKTADDQELMYQFLEKKLYASTLPPLEREAFLTFGS